MHIHQAQEATMDSAMMDSAIKSQGTDMHIHHFTFLFMLLIGVACGPLFAAEGQLEEQLRLHGTTEDQVRAELKAELVKDLDPVFRGTWVVFATSADHGKTYIPEAMRLIKAEGNHLTFPSTTRNLALTYKKVVRFRADGQPGCFLVFNEDTTTGFSLSMSPQDGEYTLQVFRLPADGSIGTESLRHRCRIER